MLPRVNSSMERSINGPEAFFRQLGNLHDSKLRAIEFNLGQQKIQLVVDDLYANFRGLAEYPGVQPVRLTLDTVSEVQFALASQPLPMRIMDFEVSQVGISPSMRVAVKFDPAGSINIVCGSIACQSA